jgi:hypothetical protein
MVYPFMGIGVDPVMAENMETLLMSWIIYASNMICVTRRKGILLVVATIN